MASGSNTVIPRVLLGLEQGDSPRGIAPSNAVRFIHASFISQQYHNPEGVVMAMPGLLFSCRSECQRVGAGKFFRVLCAAFFFGACHVNAALVSLVTPSGDGSSYLYAGQTYSIFQDIVDSTAPFGSNDGGEELVWLGAHQTWADVSGEAPAATEAPSAINVNVSGDAGSVVSLVLSSAQVNSWNINVATGIQLNNIFVIADRDAAQNIYVGGSTPVVLGPGKSDSIGDINLQRSNTTANCGYAYPDQGNDCNTFQTLGLSENESFAFVNELALMQTPAGNSEPLTLTSFNGSYYVNQFDVQLAIQPIPLPAAAWLFGFALVSLASVRSNHNTGRRRARRYRH
ncbi:MAG: hypothetical protein KJP25_04265 [Gammaproteobacteria bacterium]|nr:hypothetical protein [Gammaproteobacteria bacterium]MBT8152230.1 hypothetical protein [Gammaproteobacteria bacterium]NND40193.1 hypothetical protein [Pseudomonadales bacterium]NNM11529.1 hypothetical protein [Pseudomonadales bacterium]